MKIHININDMDGVRYVCSLHDLRFYTIPSSKHNLVELTIKHQNGKGLSEEFAFCIGRQVEASLELMRTEEKIKEHELMQQPNNVVTTIELLEDLP